MRDREIFSNTEIEASDEGTDLCEKMINNFGKGRSWTAKIPSINVHCLIRRKYKKLYFHF